MQGAERDAPILHERRCERRLMRRTSRAEANRRIGRPSVVRVDADSVAWRRISIERELFLVPLVSSGLDHSHGSSNSTHRPGYGGFLLMS